MPRPASGIVLGTLLCLAALVAALASNAPAPVSAAADGPRPGRVSDGRAQAMARHAAASVELFGAAHGTYAGAREAIGHVRDLRISGLGTTTYVVRARSATGRRFVVRRASAAPAAPRHTCTPRGKGLCGTGGRWALAAPAGS